MLYNYRMPPRTAPITADFIGVKNESALHNALKCQYAGDGGQTEVPVGDFVADGVSPTGEYIEVQTGAFGPLRKKVRQIVALGGKIRIIHPIAINKRLETYDTQGTVVTKRKSPAHGSIWDIFDALMHAPELLITPGVTIELVLADITERRVKDGKGAWRRHGISIADKTLVSILESVVFEKTSDWPPRFIPFAKNEKFTVASMAEHADAKEALVRKALYVFARTGIVKRTGKRGNAYVYMLSEPRKKFRYPTIKKVK